MSASSKFPPLVRQLARAAFWLTPSLLIMGATLWLGTGRAAGPQTRSFLEQLLAVIAPGVLSRMSPAAVDTLNFLFRKGSHFCGYACLGAMNSRAARGLLHRGGKLPMRLAGPAWLCAVLWSAVDEYHQSFTPSRTGTPADVLLDSSGAAAGTVLYLLWTHLRTRSRQAPQAPSAL